MKIVQYLSVNNDCYRNNVNKADSRYTKFQSRGPLGLMLHSVGCAQPDASVFARGWNVSGKEVAVHAVLQADGTVYQCLPWNYRGWHAGGAANDTHVGVEMTEPSQIRYTTGASFTCSDLSAARAQAAGTYSTAADLFAMLCTKYGLDPMTAIISHAEGARKGVASNHGDPEHLWKGLGLNYTMDTFRAEVKKRMNTKEDPELTEKEVQALIDKAVKAVTDATDKKLKAVLESMPVLTQDDVMDLMNDQWIEKFTDLPPWAQKEVRELIEMGALKGTKPAESVEDVTIAGSLNNLVRPMIIAYRAVKAAAGDAPKEVLAELLKKVLAGICAASED